VTNAAETGVPVDPGPTAARHSSGQSRSDPAGDRRRGLVLVARGCEVLPDLTVVLLATWTVVYHVSLVTGLRAAPAVAIEAAVLIVCGALGWRGHRRRGNEQQEATAPTDVKAPPAARPSTLERSLIRCGAVCALAAASLVAVNRYWTVIAWLWVAAALMGTAWALVRLRKEAPTEPAEWFADAASRARGSWSAVVALIWAAVLAVLSILTVWPNPDDLYYVNLSQWVVDHGTFPLRDTIFSNLVYPMSSWPPMASYDALVGVAARFAGVPAGSVVYEVVPPVATFLSVLALWRLLTAWRVKAVAVALSVALLFLLLDGGFGYAAPGNLFLIRIWQGKVILLCLMVPTLLVYALRYAEQPSWRRARWLFAGGVAAVGLSTSAMFVVPLLAVGGAAPLLLRRPASALRSFAAMAAYPLASGATTVLLGGRSADLFGSRELYRFDPAWFGNQIFRDGPPAFVAVAAVLVGAFLVANPAARVTTGVLVLITGITFIPGVTRLSYDLVGLGPTLWRVSWVATIAALVGVLGARCATLPSSRAIKVVASLAVVATMAFGVPIWSARNGVSLHLHLQWKRDHESTTDARMAEAIAKPGDIILGPEALAVTIDVSTTKVKTVAPRAYFMDYLRHDRRFHFDARRLLLDFANSGLHRSLDKRVAHALRLIHVREVCVPINAIHRAQFLVSQGYRLAAQSVYSNCFRD
jgi:hypothetical protein